jgi:hypothetical protein
MLSSQVIGLLLRCIADARCRSASSAAYFQVPPSYCVSAVLSQVIGFLLVSPISAVGPRLLPGPAVALCPGAVIPRHEKPPPPVGSGRSTCRRCVIRGRVALIPRHRNPPPPASSPLLSENRLASRSRMSTRRKLNESSASFGGTRQPWLRSRRGTPSNEFMVMSSLGVRHRRKRVTFRRQKE